MENEAPLNSPNMQPNKIKDEVPDKKQIKKSQRKLGLLESKASFVIKDDFKMTDEDF